MQTSNIKIRAWQAVQNYNVNHIHTHSTQVENNNNNGNKQFKKQEIKHGRPILHTHTH